MGRAANRKKSKRIKEATDTRTNHEFARDVPRTPCQHSLDDMAEFGACPIPKTHSRLQEAHRLWHQALDLYAEPEGFRINLNACIQALRNVTFVLQKEHVGVPNFEHWYANWQAYMKQDAIMRWLVDARNTIVKEGDLETRSHSRVSVIDYYFPTPVFVSEMPPLLTTDMIAVRLAASRNVPEALKGKAFIQVERCWVVSTLPDTELLETLAHAYGVLSNVISDAHQEAGFKVVVARKGRNGKYTAWKNPTEQLNGRLPCMVTSVEQRTSWAEFGSGAKVAPAVFPISPNPTLEAKARKRYADIELPLGLATGQNTLRQAAELHFEYAKKLLSKDGTHIAIAFLRARGKGLGMAQLEFQKRYDKYLLMPRLAREIERVGADEVILISEAWLAFRNPKYPSRSATDSPDRFEALDLMAASAAGEEIHLCAVFKRHGKNGKIIEFEPTIDNVGQPSPLLEAIREVWKRRKTADTQSGKGK